MKEKLSIILNNYVFGNTNIRTSFVLLPFVLTTYVCKLVYMYVCYCVCNPFVIVLLFSTLITTSTQNNSNNNKNFLRVRM